MMNQIAYIPEKMVNSLGKEPTQKGTRGKEGRNAACGK
jgi:hypothetical protein